MATFNLKSQDIKNLSLKLKGKLPVDREELLALVSSWGRISSFYTYDKNGYEIKINACHSNENYELSNLDVSEITNFDDIFTCSNYNEDINSWNVSNATSMECMFCEAKNFNSPLDNWNVSKVTDMSCMFDSTKKFNQNINTWNISMVTSLKMMFNQAKIFNQPLDKWDTSKVTDMSYMFYGTEKFNQNINSWNISNVTDMDYIFAYTETFNQPVLWDISKIEKYDGLFIKAKSFINNFNNNYELPRNKLEIKLWLKDNRDRMIALDIEKNKSKELDNFLSNFNGLHNIIDSTNLNELYNNRKIDDGKI